MKASVMSYATGGDVGGSAVRQTVPAMTPKGRRTRARLMEAGRAVLEENGYFDATVAEIASRSGVALGSFYHYFPNKDRLFLLLLEDLVKTLYSSTSGSWDKADARASLSESTRRYLRTYYDNRLLISSLLQMAAAVPECAEMWWELRTRTYARMETYLRLVFDEEDGDPALYTSALGTMVEEFAYHWYVEGTRLHREPPDVEVAAHVLSTIWFRTIYDKPGRS